MPDPDRLLRTLLRATEAFASTPGRRGKCIDLAECADVLVAGDLHGNLRNFRILMERADLATHPRRHLVVQELVHGPFQYPQGGDKSHQLVDILAALKCQYPERVHFLLGNHELAQWAGHFITKTDFEQTTLFRLGVRTAYGERAAELVSAYSQLFAHLPLVVRTPNRVLLTHSLPDGGGGDGFRFEVLQQQPVEVRELHYGGTIHSLVWGRDTSLESATAFLRLADADLLITGHTPCPEGFATPNERQLILDSMDVPAAYCLFPVDRLLTHPELVACVQTF